VENGTKPDPNRGAKGCADHKSKARFFHVLSPNPEPSGATSAEG
jgi:hypothetical protein